jgi:hypothetical protein
MLLKLVHKHYLLLKTLKRGLFLNQLLGIKISIFADYKKNNSLTKIIIK